MFKICHIPLIQVFTGNSNTCMKIAQHQVQKIMALVAQHKNNVPQFLDLLNAVVKVEELDLPLKRNQGFVMTYFMQFRSDVAFVIDQDEKARYSLHEFRNYIMILNEPRQEKTSLRGFRPGRTQTDMYSHRSRLEAWNFGFKKKRNCIICVAKTKALISFAVTAKLICAFFFAMA